MSDLVDLIERAWGPLSRWAVPVMMSLAYLFLAVTSETDAAGKAWMAAGLGLVMIVWFWFRRLADQAALDRAISVGDTARLLELTGQRLPRARSAAVRAELGAARGLAHLLRGEHAEALAALDAGRSAGAADGSPDASSSGPSSALSEVVRIAANGELGRVAPAASPSGHAPRTPWLAWLTAGQLAWLAGQPDVAAPLLARVMDDIRAGDAARAIAHVYAARIARARRESGAEATHRAAAARLAMPGAAWLRGGAWRE